MATDVWAREAQLAVDGLIRDALADDGSGAWLERLPARITAIEIEPEAVAAGIVVEAVGLCALILHVAAAMLDRDAAGLFDEIQRFRQIPVRDASGPPGEP